MIIVMKKKKKKENCHKNTKMTRMSNTNPFNNRFEQIGSRTFLGSTAFLFGPSTTLIAHPRGFKLTVNDKPIDIPTNSSEKFSFSLNSSPSNQEKDDIFVTITNTKYRPTMSFKFDGFVFTLTKIRYTRPYFNLKVASTHSISTSSSAVYGGIIGSTLKTGDSQNGKHLRESLALGEGKSDIVVSEILEDDYLVRDSSLTGLEFPFALQQNLKAIFQPSE